MGPFELKSSRRETPMRLISKVAAFACGAFALAPLGAGAQAPAQCAAQYLEGRAPKIDRPAVAQGAIELCNRGYAVIYSPLTNGPLASSEHLTRDQILAAASRRRDDAFHADPRLPPSTQMQLSDFSARGSCLDRGHMANDKDQASPDDAFETYALSNMVPQDTDNNERLWEGIESAVRDLTRRYGEVYVVTGPIFEGSSIQRLNGKVAMPTKLYKAFWSPSQNAVGVYVSYNGAGDAYWSLSVDQLRSITGIDVFPGLPQAFRSQAMAELPRPESHFHTNRESEGRCTPVAVPNNIPPQVGQSTGTPAPAAPGIIARTERGAADDARSILRLLRP